MKLKSYKDGLVVEISPNVSRYKKYAGSIGKTVRLCKNNAVEVEVSKDTFIHLPLKDLNPREDILDIMYAERYINEVVVP